MTWVKVDDSFPRHPKVIGLPAAVKWSYVEALCYCAQYLTDGAFPPGIVPDKDVRSLIEVGLVDLADGGSFAVHDYLEYNPSRESVQSKSKKNRSAARKRWADVVQSESDASRMQDVLGDGTGTGSASSSEQSKAFDFDAFWAVYPLHVGKIKARQEWDSLIANKADPERIVNAAVRYRDDPSRKPDFTAHPSTWLHQGRWLDEDAPDDGMMPVVRDAMRLLEARRGTA